MTAQLPPNLLALFAPRPALRYLPPADHAPGDRKTARIDGVAQFMSSLNEEFGDYTPSESWLERRDRKILAKEAEQKYKLDNVEQLYRPTEDKNIRGDAFKTLFVSRMDYNTDVKDLEREFGRFGPIERVRIVVGVGENDKKKAHVGKPRGYAFVVFEREKDMKAAYKDTENLRIKGRKVVVDVERGRTVRGWRPRRFGGGLGGRGYTQAAPAKPMGFGGPPPGPGFRGGFRGGFSDRGGGDRGGHRGGRGGFDRGDRGGYRGGRGGGLGYSNGGDFGGRAPDGAPAGPRSGGGYGGRGGYEGGGGGGRFDDRGGRNANFEPLPPRGGDRGGDRGGGYRDRDRDREPGSYAGQKRPHDGGGYDGPRSRPRY